MKVSLADCAHLNGLCIDTSLLDDENTSALHRVCSLEDEDITELATALVNDE